jgi:hypothetical protein
MPNASSTASRRTAPWARFWPTPPEMGGPACFSVSVPVSNPAKFGSRVSPGRQRPFSNPLGDATRRPTPDAELPAFSSGVVRPRARAALLDERFC